MPLIPSVPLVSNRARDSGHPMEVGISSRGLPSPCGGETPISGSTGRSHCHPTWMESFNSSFYYYFHSFLLSLVFFGYIIALLYCYCIYHLMHINYFHPVIVLYYH